MPSDVLSALLGLLAGGTSGYVETKESRRKEKLASEESASDRAFRERLLGTEIKARKEEGAAERLSRQEETKLKLQADRDNLQKQLDANMARAASANAVDRERIAVQNKEIEARIRQVDKQIGLQAKELGLKGRELDIRQANELGTGPLGTAGGNTPAANPVYTNLGDIIKAYVATDRTPETDVQFLGFIDTALKRYGPEKALDTGSALRAGRYSMGEPGFARPNIPPSNNILGPTTPSPVDAQGVGGNYDYFRDSPLAKDFNQTFQPDSSSLAGFEAMLENLFGNKPGPLVTRVPKTLRGH